VEDIHMPASHFEDHVSCGQLPPLAAEDHTCDACGLVYPETEIDDAVSVIAGLPGAVREVVGAIPPELHPVRPSPGVWSVAEYVCHLRDVYVTFTIRLHRVRTEHQARRFRYNDCDLAATLDELAAAAAGFCNEVACTGEHDWDRVVARLPGEQRTARWLVRQAMHEGVHHLGDIRRIGETLNGTAQDRGARVTVTFAGCGDAFGSGGRCQACIVVQADESPPILLDCGATSLVALKRQGVDPNTVGAVLVSHLHVDHFGGLPTLILDGQFRRRVAPLTVAGPVGTAERLTAALELQFPGASTAHRPFDVDVIELRPDTASTRIGNAIVRAVEVDHGMPSASLGLCIEVAGRTIAYSGDTAWTDVLIDLATGSDLFIAESYFWNKFVPYHLRHADLVAHRDQLVSQRIVLTHMSEDMLSHADEAAFDLAYDGRVISL
jgi:ribonuclease BN (tRNA processing enzyme)